MNFDPITVLTSIGLGKYAAGIVSLSMCVAYVVTWFAPLMPAPTDADSRAYKMLYAIIQKIGANVGHAANLGDATPSAALTQAASPAAATAANPGGIGGTGLPLGGLLACLLFSVGIVACTTLPAGTPPSLVNVNVTLTKAQADAQKAIKLYGIAKGIAQIAMMAEPDLAPVLTATFATTDPLVAKAQMALDDASADANALEMLVEEIQAQANAVTVQSAAVIKVVPAT